MMRLLLSLLIWMSVAVQVPLAPPLSLVPAGAEFPQTGEGQINGVVKTFSDQKPMAGVSVALSGPLNASSATSRLTVATTSEGQFQFRNLVPGRYTVSVRQDGYFVRTLPGTSDGGQITVGPGRSVTFVNLSMVRGGTISGRILDPMGRPSPATSVTAARQLYRDGKPVLGPVKTATSDDRGEYRIFWLEPGEYVVSAERTLPGGGPARGYFPGSDDGRAAIAVRVSESMDSSRTDFSLGAIPATVTVSGMVIHQIPALETPAPAGAPSVPAAAPATQMYSPTMTPQFFLVPLDAPRLYEGITEYPNAVTNRDRLEGRFELRNVRRGSYDLFAVVRDYDSKYYMAHQTIDVGIQDLSALVLTLKPGIDLIGTVTAGIGKPSPTVRIQLRPRTLLPDWEETAVVSTAGSFRIPNVPVGQYSITVEPADRNLYVAELLQGRDSIVDRGVVTVLHGLADTLDLLMQPSSSTVRGTVVAKPSQLADGVMITLVPEESRRENVALYRRAVTVDGFFSFAGIAPGRYRVFAWDRIPEGAELNAEFIEAYRGSGVDVAVLPGSTSSVDVRLISK